MTNEQFYRIIIVSAACVLIPIVWRIAKPYLLRLIGR